MVGPWHRCWLGKVIACSASMWRQLSLSTIGKNVPACQTECNAILESSFFERKFDAVLASGLIFLMPEADQSACLRRIADAIETGGRFLFTAPMQVCQWQDLTSGTPSCSLGAEKYRALLNQYGLDVLAEFSGEGGNYYYDSTKRR